MEVIEKTIEVTKYVYSIPWFVGVIIVLVIIGIIIFIIKIKEIKYCP